MGIRSHHQLPAMMAVKIDDHRRNLLPMQLTPSGAEKTFEPTIPLLKNDTTFGSDSTTDLVFTFSSLARTHKQVLP